MPTSSITVSTDDFHPTDAPLAPEKVTVRTAGRKATITKDELKLLYI